MEIGDRIRILRDKDRLKQGQMADRLFVSPQAVSSWERGKCTPDLAMLVKLSDMFNTSLDYIVKGHNPVRYWGVDAKSNA